MKAIVPKGIEQRVKRSEANPGLTEPPPNHTVSAELWTAYDPLAERPPTANPTKILTNLIILVRHNDDYAA